MDPKDINLTKVSKKIERTDFVYLGVIFIFLVITITIFFYSTSFIISNVNKIFSTSNGGDNQALDMARYSLTEKKLSLPVNIVSDNTATNPVIQPVTPSVTTTSNIAPTLDKKSITLSILNNSTKIGVASTLAKALENAGFSKATTGNEKIVYTVTTILIKDSKKDYAPLIEEVVKKSYPQAVTTTNPESSKFDAIIIISK